MRNLLQKFRADRGGNYAMMTAILMLPLMGALTLGVDYAEMSRQRSLALNALDAAGIGTARRYLEGNISDADLKIYANNFFKANYGGQDFSRVKLTLVLPTATAGGSTVKLSAAMTYEPYFLPVLRSLLGSTTKDIDFYESTEVKLKNTLEVAMALDNSGSMSEKGGSSGQVRIDLLKQAAKQLVDTLGNQGAAMTQVAKPVQFSLVPFAASVNVGPGYADAAWMDRDGIAPAHHENFDWLSMAVANPLKAVLPIGGIYYKKGLGWGAEENKKVTRFSLFEDIKRISGWTTSNVTILTPGAQPYCTKTNSSGNCTKTGYRVPNYSAFSTWGGCVEARPFPYNNNDAVATAATPSTLFQPMFAPDETDRVTAYNSWWDDGDSSSSNSDITRQKYMPKYFEPAEVAAEGANGPNLSCTTTPITPLTDVVNTAGRTSIKAAIDNMEAGGGTSVPEGMAWGWRTVSNSAPFSEGRPESENGNDKVVIVVTDGANTYYTPGSLQNGNADSAGNKSIYSSYGYAINGRIFGGTSAAVNKTNYSNANYSTALNEQFATLCANAKAQKIMVMTVALDLNASDTAEAAQIAMLKSCASDSRYRKDAANPSKPAKLFWNSTGASLANDFKEIGNELSNLRIIF